MNFSFNNISLVICWINVFYLLISGQCFVAIDQFVLHFLRISDGFEQNWSQPEKVTCNCAPTAKSSEAHTCTSTVLSNRIVNWVMDLTLNLLFLTNFLERCSRYMLLLVDLSRCLSIYSVMLIYKCLYKLMMDGTI